MESVKRENTEKMTRYIGLRIDVDTSRGMERGVPVLLNLLRLYGARASFFFSVGPETWGKAFLRIFSERGFLRRMILLNPFKAYGLLTLLRGTLVPGKFVVSDNSLLLRIVDEGHELGLHGYDHRWWQDRVMKNPLSRLGEEVENAIVRMKDLGFSDLPWASPGWRVTPEALQMMERFNFPYAGDVRGDGLFYPRVNGRALRTIQVPVSLPTLDEIYARRSTMRADVPGALIAGCRLATTPVLALHAEIEGMAWRHVFRDILETFHSVGYSFVPLGELVKNSEAEAEIPVSSIRYGRVPGRSGFVACRAGIVQDSGTSLVGFL